MFDIGGWELLLIAIIALISVPAKDFPSLVASTARAFGRLRYTIDNWQQQINFAIENEEHVQAETKKQAKTQPKTPYKPRNNDKKARP
ncbi:MAG: hypothetical protein GDA50_00420 [Alphaproteobacteria bacterium GM202ARS2]|nr:hypothetical protein [Alphaproteobacteria bacterium GM202ARS2]